MSLNYLLETISDDAACRSCLITDPRQPDNPIVYVTPEFERHTGYTRAEAIGRNCRFLQGPMTDPGAVARIRRALAARQPITIELVNYRKDGTPFLNRLSIRPRFDPSGALDSFVAVQAIGPVGAAGNASLLPLLESATG